MTRLVTVLQWTVVILPVVVAVAIICVGLYALTIPTPN